MQAFVVQATEPSKRYASTSTDTPVAGGDVQQDTGWGQPKSVQRRAFASDTIRQAAMSQHAPLIERLDLPVRESDLRGLGELLADAVESGAAVSFLAPLTDESAIGWWRHTIDAAPASAIFLVARDADGIVGTVQLQPAWAQNQPHRAEVVKLLVHRRCRRTGLGVRLMQAIEEGAQRAGFGLLTLDAKRGAEAERLYRRLGWTQAGTIPRFAFDPDGISAHDAVIFYKQLDQPGASLPPATPA